MAREVAARPSTLYTHEERLAGYREALFEAGVPGTPAWERTDATTVVEAEAAVVDLLTGSDPPTAILAGNNRASTGLLRALRRVDRQVAFIGFDDFDLADTLGITVVAHDPAHMGREAVRLALARHTNLTAPLTQAVIPTKLIRRGSGETPPPR
jgi:LacI family transcriptional regulator